MLRGLAHQGVEQLDDNRAHNQAKDKPLKFVPNPRSEFLIGKVVAMLEAKLVVFERGANRLADKHQHQDVKENSERIILRSAAFRQIAEGPRPSCSQQHNQQTKTNRKISNAQPPLGAVIAARFRRIGDNECVFFESNHAGAL